MENPYLQLFIGGESFTTEAPFEVSMMVHFRKGITSKINGTRLASFDSLIQPS
jgi:hypothetical protein